MRPNPSRAVTSVADNPLAAQSSSSARLAPEAPTATENPDATSVLGVPACCPVCASEALVGLRDSLRPCSSPAPAASDAAGGELGPGSPVDEATGSEDPPGPEAVSTAHNALAVAGSRAPRSDGGGPSKTCGDPADGAPRSAGAVAPEASASEASAGPPANEGASPWWGPGWVAGSETRGTGRSPCSSTASRQSAFWAFAAPLGPAKEAPAKSSGGEPSSHWARRSRITLRGRKCSRCWRRTHRKRSTSLP